MCRLFGLLGSSLTPAEPWLVSTDRSLLAQSDTSPEHRQNDGWGIGWYETTRTAKVEKGIHGAFQPEEKEHYLRAAHRAKGPVVIGHIRDASNPLGLPKERLIALENSQPFSYGSYLFAHNGMIPLPRETRPLLGKFEANVQGVNDSEVLFWLIVHHLETMADPLAAYSRTVEDLQKTWGQSGNPGAAPYSGLNVLFSRGPNELWAFCLYLGEHGGRLLDPSHPYYEMTYAADAKHVVVGSEPFDERSEGWHSIPNGTYLYAHRAHGLVALKTGAIPIAATARSR